MKKYFLIFMLALSQHIGFGQIIIAEDFHGNPGESICVDIIVEDFHDIIVMQFSMNWDTNAMQFDSIGQMNYPGLTVDSFELNFVDEGKLGVSWDGGPNGPNAIGVTLPDGQRIFQLCFTLTENCNYSTVQFSDDPLSVCFVLENSSANCFPPLAFIEGTVYSLIQSLPNDTTLCHDEFLQLDLEVAPTATNVQWSSTNGYLEFTCTDCLQPTITFGSNTPFGQSSDTAIVTVSNDEGCEEIAAIELNTSWYVDMFPAEPVRYFCEGDDISFANEDLLIGPYVYHWTGPNNFNDIQIFPTILNASVEDAGIYTVEVTDAYGCGFSLQYEVIPGIQITLEEVIPESCPDNLDGSITVSVQGGEGDLEFIWSNGSTTPYTISELVTGDYFLTVVDENDCAGVLENIMVDTGLVVSITADTIICGGEPLQLQVEAPNAESYQWYSLEPLSCTDCPNPVVDNAFLDDTYIVEVTGANGCMQTAEVNVQVRQYLDFGLLEFSNSPLCEGDTLFFEPNVFNAQFYEWTGPGNFHSNQSHPFIANVTTDNAGEYLLEIIDDAGCMTGASFDVQITDELPIHIYIEEPSCFGICDGSVQITPLGGTPPYTYSWIDGPSGATRPDLCAGDYAVTVSSDNCSTIAYISLPEPPELQMIHEVTTNASCIGGGGMITIWVTGGTLPYWVDWGTGPIENGSILDDLSAGVYSITVTDANNCEIVSPDIELTDNPIFSISEDDLICDGETAPLQLEAPFAATVSWTPATGLDDPASLMPIASPAQTTTYTATVMDINGCMGSASVTVFVGDDDCIWVNQDTISVGESGEWCDPTLGTVRFGNHRSHLRPRRLYRFFRE